MASAAVGFCRDGPLEESACSLNRALRTCSVEGRLRSAHKPLESGRPSPVVARRAVFEGHREAGSRRVRAVFDVEALDGRRPGLHPEADSRAGSGPLRRSTDRLRICPRDRSDWMPPLRNARWQARYAALPACSRVCDSWTAGATAGHCRVEPRLCSTRVSFRINRPADVRPTRRLITIGNDALRGTAAARCG